MAGKRRKFVVVRLRAETDRKTGEPRTDEQGRRYWIARWAEDGKRPTETIGWATDDEAEERRVAIESRLRLGMTPSDGTSSSATVTVDGVIQRYLRDLGERGCADRHVENEIDRLAAVGRQLGKVAADRLERHDLDQYIARRRRDPGRRRESTAAKRTVEQEIAILIRAYRVARKTGLISCAPPEWPSFKAWPDDHRPHRRLLEGEVASLVAAADAIRPELGRLLQFLAWCPRRPVAVFSLRRRDCARALDERLPRAQRQALFTRDKGGVGRGWSPITEPALAALVEHLRATAGDPDDLVWTSETGRPLTAALLFYPFKAAVRAAGLEDVQVYDLRRFGAVTVQAATGNLSVTCEYTGHRDVRTLLRYLSAPRGVAEQLAGSIGWTPAEETAETGTGTTLRVISGSNPGSTG